MRKLALPLVALALVAAGCGGGDDDEPATETSTPAAASGGGGTAVEISSPEDGALEFDKTELTARAGKITINYDNPSSTPHAVEIEGEGASETVTVARTSVTAQLEPGTYTYFCPVGNHRDGGMEGTLTVE